MEDRKKDILGHLSAFSAYVIWGVLPIYWKQIDHVPAREILAHRVLWGFVFLLLFNIFSRRKDFFRLLKDRHTRKTLYLTSALIAVNWLIFIFAVISGHIVDASLGYFINPLVSVFLGMIFFREKLNLLKTLAVILAMTGMLYLAIDYGKFPWISIGLALSFGFYGLAKKSFNLDPINSIMSETLFLSVIAIGYLAFLAGQGTGHFAAGDSQTNIYLIIGGFVTMLPLYLFANGATKIPLASVGFLQYFAPSLMLLIGIFKYGEPLTETYLISFLFIWSGLALYTFNLVRNRYRSYSQKRRAAR
ncbi:MAG: EamA family transporter RarD [Bacteroidales bacterium]|nr:EamA family transporter RarD [Bacteroidales bacterium]